MNERNRFRPDSSGVFLAPRDVASLREEAQRAGCAWLEVRLASVHDKAGFLTAAARDLGFPSHFGHNWDAFADCIADPAGLSKCRVIAFTGSAAFAERGPDDWATALEILRNAAAEWRARKRTFVVLVDRAPRDVALQNFS